MSAAFLPAAALRRNGPLNPGVALGEGQHALHLRLELLALLAPLLDEALDVGAHRLSSDADRAAKGLVEQGTKSKASRRLLTLADPAKEALTRHLERREELKRRAGAAWEEKGLVFTNETGGPLTPESVSQVYLPEVLKLAGLRPIRFHDLRHTAASLLLLRRVNAKVVQQYLGHSTITPTLKTYSHILAGIDQEAVNQMNAAFRGE